MCRATAKVAEIQEETADAFLGALADSDIDKWTVSLKLSQVKFSTQLKSSSQHSGAVSDRHRS